jgi:hypothetical protein
VISLDPSRREEAIAAGWLAYRERVPTMYAKYLAACEGWEVVAVTNHSEVIGALFARDGVIHLGIVPNWRGRWASRRVIREMLTYGKTTTVLDEEPQCIDFVSRIGFEKKGQKYEFRL